MGDDGHNDGDRGPDGKFRQGNSTGRKFAKGNANGRGNTYQAKVAQFRECLVDSVTESEVAALARTWFDKAAAGDMRAFKVLAPYLFGRPQPVTDEGSKVAIDLPQVTSAADVALGARKVMDAVAAGEIGMEDAGRLMGMLSVMRATLETSVLESKIDELLAERRELQG